MELSRVNNQDSDILLKGKNALNETVIDKYRLAGQVSQTGLSYVISLIHDSYHLGKINPPLTPAEICALGDSYLYRALSTVYQKGSKAVNEKGIAYPVSLDINDSANGISPELSADASFNNPTNNPFKPGDIVKITLGAHIDGYTALVSHTVVIYPPPDLTNANPQPEGPLLGPKADAICAVYAATEAVVSLLGCALFPEKLPENLATAAPSGNNSQKITGSLIRKVVDKVAESFGCVVVPGSKVRRIRRFLAGQAENIVAEKEFKGVVWAEAHQEYNLLQRSKQLQNGQSDALITMDNGNYDKLGISESSAIPTDEFVITPGEVYAIDIKMASVAGFSKPGVVTLQNVDGYSGKNHNKTELVAKSDVYIRDFAISYTLKLKSARLALSKIENTSSVYPFKLNHLSENFPIKTKLSIDEQREIMAKIAKDINKSRLGLSECVNNHLVVEKKIQLAKFLPLEDILNSSNENARPTGYNDLTLMHNNLPGFEVPLPKLGITHLKLKSLLKKSEKVDVAREVTTIALNNSKVNDNKPAEVLRITGGSKSTAPNWVHSNYKLQDEDILNLIKLGQDQRFGIKIKECLPMKLTDIKNDGTEKMAMD